MNDKILSAFNDAFSASVWSVLDSALMIEGPILERLRLGAQRTVLSDGDVRFFQQHSELSRRTILSLTKRQTLAVLR